MQKKKHKLRLELSHHRRYEWILISPANEMIRTKVAVQFCKERELSYSSLRYKAQQNDCTPIKRGQSKGWIVFATRKI
jgi:hypothetical protein